MLSMSSTKELDVHLINMLGKVACMLWAQENSPKLHDNGNQLSIHIKLQQAHTSSKT